MKWHGRSQLRSRRRLFRLPNQCLNSPPIFSSFSADKVQPKLATASEGTSSGHNSENDDGHSASGVVPHTCLSWLVAPLRTGYKLEKAMEESDLAIASCIRLGELLQECGEHDLTQEHALSLLRQARVSLHTQHQGALSPVHAPVHT